MPAAHLGRRTPGFHVEHHEPLRKRRNDTLRTSRRRASQFDIRRHNGLLLRLFRFQPAHSHISDRSGSRHDPLQQKQRPRLVDGPVSRAALGRVYARRATQFAGAPQQQIPHRREQFRKARESRTAQPRAAGQPIIHENGGHPELRVHGRGNAAEIITIRHDHQRHEPDTRMFQRVDGAHEMHEAVLGSPARAIRHAKPQALRLENQRRQIQRHDADQPVVGNGALLIAGNRLRDPQPPERDGRTKRRARGLHFDDGGFLVAPDPGMPVYPLLRHLAADNPLRHIKAFDHIRLPPMQIDRAGVRLLVRLMPVHAADGPALGVHNGTRRAAAPQIHMPLRALAGGHPFPAVRRFEEQPLPFQLPQRRLSARPTQPRIITGQRQFRRRAFEMPLDDDVVVGIDDRPFRLAPEKRLGLMDEILIQRVLARDEQHRGFLPGPPHATAPLHGRNDRARIPHKDAHVEAAYIDPQFQRAGRNHGKQLPVAHAGFDLAPFLGQKARPVRADAAREASGLVSGPQRDEFRHAP